MSIEDVLSWLSRRLSRGTLTVEHAAEARSFVCDSGYVVEASSNLAREELGQMLLDAGWIDQEALAEARSVQADTGVSLARILRMVGKLDEERLRAVLEERALRAVLEIFTWEDGSFAFERMDEAPSPDVAVALQLPLCIEKGRERSNRWRELQERIPDEDIGIELLDSGALAKSGDSEADRRAHLRVAQVVRERAGEGEILSVAQLAAQLGWTRFRTMDRVVVLCDRGALGLQEQASSAGVDFLLEESLRLSEEGDRLGAFELARRAHQSEPELAKERYETAERALFAELSRELLASFRVPKLLIERGSLESMDLSDAERTLAQRVDGRWDLLSLMRASSVREAEALITLKRLADRGIISL